MSYRKKKPIELFVEKDIDHDELLKDIFKDSMEQSIQSFNHFLNYEMEKIFQNSAMEYRENGRVILLRFSDVQMDNPNVIVSQVPREITPQFCRVTGTTYSCPIRVVVKHFERSENGNNLNLISKERLEIGSMPIMVRSCKCILNGKNEAELAKYGECPLDYGGYFIINGTEKVVLIQEKPSRNRIIIDTDKMGNLNASVTSIFESMEIRTVIQMENSKFYVMPNHIITRKIPLMVVMVAMGLRDQLVEMFTRNPLGEGDPRYIDLHLPSIEECTKKRIETEELALRYPGLEGNKGKIFFQDTFLIKANEDKPYLKCVYVALILRRLMDAYLHKDAKAMDDKDYLGNKRFLLSGELISLLFEDLFKALSRQAVKEANTMLAKSGRLKEDWSKDKSYLRSYCRCLRKNLTAGLERSLFTGNWNVKQFKMNQIGMTQGLSSLSYIGRLSLMTRIRPYLMNPIVSSPRALHPSELGMLCPLDATTEGKSFGLARNLALLSRISTDEKEELLVTVFHDLGVKDLQELSGEESYTAESFLVIFNGRIIGTHASPQEFATSIRRSRRKCRKVKVGKFVSVFVNAKQRCVYIASDGGRLCRPLIIVEDGVSKVKKCVKYDVVVKEGSRALDYFLRNGYIEYLDVDEENNALIALREQDITKNTTHLEIEPSTIFGACAGLIPYLHHNSCSSNISQCAVGKEAMGNIAYNQLCRMDTELNLLVYPQKPWLMTRTIELVGYDKLGAGQNATVAVMSFSGYDMGDAIVMNKASLERGFGRCTVMRSFSTKLQSYEYGIQEKTVRPCSEGSDTKRMQLDMDGLPAPGEIIKPGDIVINKQTPKDTWNAFGNRGVEYKDTPVTFNGLGGEPSVVDKVARFSDFGGICGIKYLMRQTRQPEVGDQFSSRHGQKGVCGAIIQQEDFPFSERGICPDLIINPHAFPSGMTVGSMIELLGAKARVSVGGSPYNGSAFEESSGGADKVEEICKELVKKKFSYSGKEFLYSGITGSCLQAYVFMGPIYYQTLRHMVMDKMHSSYQSKPHQLTRQPTYRSDQDGVRVGENECNCLTAHGASMVIFERLMLSSDVTTIEVCGVCGSLGYYNRRSGKKICSSCQKETDISTQKVPYACKLLIQELQSMNISMKLKLADEEINDDLLNHVAVNEF